MKLIILATLLTSVFGFAISGLALHRVEMNQVQPHYQQINRITKETKAHYIKNSNGLQQQKLATFNNKQHSRRRLFFRFHSKLDTTRVILPLSLK